MDSKGEGDWGSLVDEMEQIRGRVQQALNASEEAPEAGQAAAIADSGEESKGSDAPSSPDYASMDEMLSGMGREEIEADSKKGLAPTDNVVRLDPPSREPVAPQVEARESVLNLAVMGAMRLKLELTREGQSVQIHLEESQLRVELSDGAEFRIPLKKAA